MVPPPEDDDDGEGLPVASKKKSAPSDKQLRATVEKLRSTLERTEAKVEKWRTEARRQEKVVADLEGRLKKANKRARKLAAVTPGSAGKRSPARRKKAPQDEPVLPEAAPTGDGPTPREDHEVPDDTWTVVRLRAEARSRGLAGLSNKSKADLLAALR
jgi:hypothetical protein